MTIRERNYRKHPHTASFLQKFHSAGSGLPAYTGQAVADAEERSALNFVTGGGRNRGEMLKQVSGWDVLTGPGLVTEKQAKWMISIANRPSVTDAMRDSLRTRLGQGFARSAASQFIDRYKDTPIATRNEAVHPGASDGEISSAESAKVADGRYAVEEDGTLKFFKVKNGRKAGYVFLDIQASDEWHSVRNVSRIRTILALIAEDELSAARRYGMELGKCSRCGRTLTDETSRAYGIGPDCRNK